MQKELQKRSTLTASTVEEKIHIEKRLPFDPDSKTGPTIDLYFHELNSEKATSQKVLNVFGSILLGILFVVTLPVAALGITLFSNEPIFRTVTTPGRRGIIFQQYLYPTSRSESDRPFRFGTFLRKTGLYKLPLVINIWKGQINLVGPKPYPAEWSNYWNRQLSDYYKRFSLNPGYFTVGEPITDPDDIQQLEASLEEELQYILNPSLGKDIKYVLGIR